MHVIGNHAVSGHGGTLSYQPAQYRVVKRPMLTATAYAQDLVNPDMVDTSHTQHYSQTAGFYSAVNRNSSNSKRGVTSGRSSGQESHNSSSSTSVSSNALSTSSHSQPSVHAHNSPYAQTNNSNSSKANKNPSHLPGMVSSTLSMFKMYLKQIKVLQQCPG